MLRKQILTLCSLFVLALSCSKKDKVEPAPEENKEVKAIQEYLLQTDDLKTFGTSFQKITIAEADASAGLTVFAPVNSAITAYDPNARVMATELSEAEIKDHIVKGVIKKADLIHGKKFTSLSGKELVITVEGDKIKINEALIGNIKEDALQHIIYTINDVLSKKPTTAEITVYDGTRWTTADTLGKTTADAEVTLYYSREDFINNRPAFTGKTDASGKVTFAGLPAGTYYLVAKKDDKYNYFDPGFSSGTMVGYKAAGIFQTTEQVNSLPRLANTVPGDFILADVNADGKIDANDKTPVPFEITVTSNKTTQVKSMIGYSLNRLGAIFASKDDAQTFLNSTYSRIGSWHQLLTITDGVLSDDADTNTTTTWHAIDNFMITANNANISNLWQSGYSCITNLNRLILNVPLLNISAEESNLLIAQARALRGFMYLQLSAYFGELPLQDKITGDFLFRKSLPETYEFIEKDLNYAITILPARWNSGYHRRISANTCKLLLARVAMAYNNYSKVKQYTNELIQSGLYQLVNANEIFLNEENAEIIWIINSVNPSYSGFFGTRKFSPAARYSEVLLMNTEAKINLGELDATNVNMLLTRRGESTVTFTDKTQATDILRNVWKNEQHREGQRFPKLLKWGLTWQVLANKGFSTKNELLPIPTFALNKNPNLMQNGGY
jgi:uncharacterized surface protein with fasciclin (FAS1) repeats